MGHPRGEYLAELVRRNPGSTAQQLTRLAVMDGFHVRASDLERELSVHPELLSLPGQGEASHWYWREPSDRQAGEEPDNANGGTSVADRLNEMIRQRRSERARPKDTPPTRETPAVTESAIVELVRRFPGRMAKELAWHLSEARNETVQAVEVTRILEQIRNVYSSIGQTGDRIWYASEEGDPPEVPARPTTPSARTTPTLYPWQEEALEVWQQHRYQGVIEAVTGAGKTMVALRAARDALESSLRVAVIVPTRELMDQWVRLCRAELTPERGISIGRLGGGQSDDLNWCDVLVATASSGSRYQMLPEGSRGLLIGDEVHRLGAPNWSRVLEESFERRMGLTATYERNDSGIENFLDPYFGGVIMSVDYHRALAEGAIAPFKIALVGVRLSGPEQDQYEEYDEYARRRRAWLIENAGVPAEPFGDFIREVHRLSEEGMREAGFYLSAFSRRRAILADSPAKHAALAALLPAVRTCERAIVFTQTRDSAERAVFALQSGGIESGLLTSDLSQNERKNALAEFEEGESQAIAAPILLDEGVDVPEADMAIIISSSRSRRQMIQRMGRVIRPKEDGRLARVVVLFVEGTFEDPRVGQEAFLDLVLPAAEEIRVFERGFDERELIDYLNDWRPRASR